MEFGENGEVDGVDTLRIHTLTHTDTGVHKARARMTAKDKVDCMEYRINMDPAAPFGQCLCGAPKEKHSAAAFKGAKDKLERVDSGALREKMTQRQKTDCTLFRLDMSPSAQFGMCVCGRPKAEHSDEALKGGAPRKSSEEDAAK